MTASPNLIDFLGFSCLQIRANIKFGSVCLFFLLWVLFIFVHAVSLVRPSTSKKLVCIIEPQLQQQQQQFQEWPTTCLPFLFPYFYLLIFEKKSSNLWWVAISVCKSFGPAKGTGLSKCFQQYPTTYIWVSNQVLLIIDYCGFTCGLRLRVRFIVYSNLNQTWNSLIGWGVLLELSGQALSHGMPKTFADWVWHSS